MTDYVAANARARMARRRRAYKRRRDARLAATATMLVLFVMATAGFLWPSTQDEPAPMLMTRTAYAAMPDSTPDDEVETLPLAKTEVVDITTVAAKPETLPPEPQHPSKWVLPEEVWVHIPGQNRVKLGEKQVANLTEIYEFFAFGIADLPEYSEGLAPHLAAAIAGCAGQEDGLRNLTDRANGHFGHFQLDDYLYRAYKAWCQEKLGEFRTASKYQSAFLWDTLNGWGEGEWFNEGHYRQTLVDFLAAETVEEAAKVLNAGKDGDPTDGRDGFFRGNMANRAVWGRQIYDQLTPQFSS